MATIATLSVLLEAKNQTQFLGALGKVSAAITGAVVASGKLAERGGKVQTVQSAFVKLTGRQADALDRLRASTLGLVGDYELMEQANTALTLGSAETVEQFAQMAATAQQLGRALGLDTAFALNSLNVGIARQSKLILDNLGLIVDVTTANRKYAAAIGVSVDALTDAQKKEAFRIEALDQARQKTEELGSVTLNAGDAFRQLTVETKNTTDALATTAASSSALGATYLSLAEIMRVLRGETRETGELQKQYEEDRIAAAEKLGTFARGGTFNDEVEKMRAAMVAAQEQAAAFRESQNATAAFNHELDFLGGLIQNVTVPAINPLTGKLLDFGDASHLLGTEFIPDLTGAIDDSVDSFLAYQARVTEATAANSKFSESAMEALTGLSAITGIAGFLGFSVPGIGRIGSLVSGLSGLDKLFGKTEGRAHGGPVTGGTPYTVGERGPELFVPGQSGTIVPNGGLTLNVSVAPARNAIEAGRDPEWQRAIAEGARELMSNGFRFA